MTDDDRGYARPRSPRSTGRASAARRPPCRSTPMRSSARAQGLSAEAFAYLAGGAGAEATMAANRAAFPAGGSGRASARRLGARPLHRAARTRAGHAVPARAARRHGARARRRRRRRRARGGRARRPVRALEPGLAPDGGGRRGDGRADARAGSSSTGAPRTSSTPRWCGAPRRPAARPSSSRSTRTCSAGARATSTSPTCRSRAARASRSTPATPSSPTSCASGSRAAAAAGRATPEVTPTLLASAFASRARVPAPVSRGRRSATRLRSPLPRAAVETFLDVFSTPALTWADSRSLREWTRLPDPAEGHPASG